MLPTEHYCHLNAQQLTLELVANADLMWFQGHFPTLPILPGVAQLDWVMHYAAQLVPGKQFAAVESIKFQQPVPPNARLRLTLTWDEDKSRLSFSYQLLREGVSSSASSGKISLC